MVVGNNGPLILKTNFNEFQTAWSDAEIGKTKEKPLPTIMLEIYHTNTDTVSVQSGITLAEFAP